MVVAIEVGSPNRDKEPKITKSEGEESTKAES